MSSRDDIISNNFNRHRGSIKNISKTVSELSKYNQVNSYEDYLEWKKKMDRTIEALNNYSEQVGKYRSEVGRYVQSSRITEAERDRLILLSTYRCNSKYFDLLTKAVTGYKDNPSFSREFMEDWYKDSEEAIYELTQLRDRTVQYLLRYNNNNTKR